MADIDLGSYLDMLVIQNGRMCVWKTFIGEDNISGLLAAFDFNQDGSVEIEYRDRWGKQVYSQSGTKKPSWDAVGLPDVVYYCAIEYQCMLNSNKKRT